MDSRLLASNGRVAHASLQGQLTADAFVQGEVRQVAAAVSGIFAEAAGTSLQRQLLYGEQFTVLEDRGGFSFGISARDGHVGYLNTDHLGPASEATHIVSSRGTHFYPTSNIKAPPVMAASFGTRIRIVSASGNFFETDAGLFVPRNHVRPAKLPFNDPASVAQLFFGTPYLWGGNSSAGIDCSGLVQAAFLGCAIACPADSDQQEKAVGEPLDELQQTQRGDLIFWAGHVAIAVDHQTLIHANAHDMSVTYEPIEAAVSRIADQGGCYVTSRKRV